MFDALSGVHIILRASDTEKYRDLVPGPMALTHQWERQTIYMENLFGKKNNKVIRQECDGRKNKNNNVIENN